MHMAAAFWCAFSMWLFANTCCENAYLGCFYDNYSPTGQRYRVLPLGQIQDDNTMTIGKCVNHCLDWADIIRYAGVEATDECFCGTQHAQYDAHGQRPDSECNQPCAGDVNQICGADFRIAVYDLNLLGCRLSQLSNVNASASPSDFVPVRMFATFACLPGYVPDESKPTQCVIGNSLNDIRWNSSSPVCIRMSTASAPDTMHTSTQTSITSGTEMITVAKPPEKQQQNIIVIAAAAGGVGLLVILCSMLVIGGCIRKRNRQKEHNESRLATQTHNNHIGINDSTLNQIGNEQSAENLYGEPTVHSPVVNPITNTNTTSRIQNHQRLTTPAYAYADVSINPPNIQITDRPIGDKPIDEESGWVGNVIYSRTAGNGGFVENDHEGWEDNRIYVTSNE